MDFIHIIDENDYYEQASKILKWFKNDNDNFKYYKVFKDIGCGGVERIVLNDSIEISMMDMKLFKDINYKFSMSKRGFEICYCIEGSFLFGDCTKNIVLKMNKNELIYWQNKTEESWVYFPKNKRFKTLSVYFNENFYKQIPEELLKYEYKYIEKIRSNKVFRIYSSEIIESFLKIAEYKCKKNSISRLLYLQSKALEIVSLFLENIYTKKEITQINNISRDDLVKLQAAKQIIEENMIEPLSIKELSETIKLNTYKLKVGFKQLFGTTIFGYLRDIRMEKAKEYFVNNKMKVIDVANSVGYSNPSHFAEAFKKKFGVNPSDYRINQK